MRRETGPESSSVYKNSEVIIGGAFAGAMALFAACTGIASSSEGAFRIENLGLREMDCLVVDLDCMFQTTLEATNISSRPIHRAGWYTGIHSPIVAEKMGMEFLGFDDKWTWGQSETTKVIQPGEKILTQVRVRPGLEVGTYTRDMYAGGRVNYNPNTNPPDLVAVSGSRTSVTVNRVTEIVDKGRFPQCMELNYRPQEDLDRQPLIDYPESNHPQVQFALDTLEANGMRDKVLVADLLPKNIELRFLATPGGPYCLPKKHSRYFIQTGEGAGRNFSTRGRDEKGTVIMSLPEGINPIYLEMNIEQYPGGPEVPHRFVWANLAPDQPVKFDNSDGTFPIVGFGPIVVDLSRGNPGGEENPVQLAEIVFPEDPQW